jgi:hypothetical protein
MEVVCVVVGYCCLLRQFCRLLKTQNGVFWELSDIFHYSSVPVCFLLVAVEGLLGITPSTGRSRFCLEVEVKACYTLHLLRNFADYWILHEFRGVFCWFLLFRVCRLNAVDAASYKGLIDHTLKVFKLSKEKNRALKARSDKREKQNQRHRIRKQNPRQHPHHPKKQPHTLIRRPEKR